MEIILILLVAVLILLLSAGIPLILRSLGRRSGHPDTAKTAVLEERLTALTERNAELQRTIDGLAEDVQGRDREIAALERDLAVTRNELRNEKEAAGEKIRTLVEARQELTNQFKVLADGILKENARSFKEQNAAGIGEILNPLKEKLAEFQKKIQDNYETEGKERHSLRNEVQKLAEMNARLTQEAANLTNALKGESKTQGNWGEMILQRILEVSGLRKGEEYTIQESHSLEDGSRLQPDVVIHLPDDRHMVIDSKVSLNAYDAYVNASDEETQQEALKQHIASVRSHMKGLAGKEYHTLHDDKSPDFVIMFIPIEPAFMLAIAEDAALWEDAWKNNVLLVSSSTLLFVMRIVMQLWRQEHRSRNAVEIARRGAALYDKIAGFVQDFDEVGRRIDQSRKSFESARGKLTEGRGNVVRQAEMLRELGISPAKQIPEDYTDAARSDEAGRLPFEE